MVLSPVSSYVLPLYMSLSEVYLSRSLNLTDLPSFNLVALNPFPIWSFSEVPQLPTSASLAWIHSST